MDRSFCFAASVLAALTLGAAKTAFADTIRTEAGVMTVTPVVTGLVEPWGFGVLPDGAVLVTERDGRLLRAFEGTVAEVDGLPRIAANGQGGLLDILVPRDFARTRALYFTYSAPAGLIGAAAQTAVFRATLSEDGAALRDVETIFEGNGATSGGRHFGSRLVEAPDGTLFVTIGDRGDPPSAQDPDRHNGKILRIAKDGSVPPDNPFVDVAGHQPEIWSLGHRNPQGAALDRDGQLWTAEHGARGGDEINRIEPGVNYGWPVISYGVNYNGTPIGEGREKAGMAQPVFYWDPSIAPSGMVFYDGDAVPDWRGDAFVGSLNSGYIARLSGTPLAEVERIAGEQTGRVRDLAVGPDGRLWYLSVVDGALYSLGPATGG
jgi:glucose/arabinose dehydrogenase